MPLHPKVQKIRHFSSRHRTRLSILRHPLAGNGSVGGLFYRGAIPRGATRPFFTPPRDGGYLRSSHLGCAPHVELAPDVLRPLSGSAGPSVQPTPCDAGLNAAALLVSGGHPYSLAIPTYYDPLRLSPKRRSGVSRLVSGGFRRDALDCSPNAPAVCGRPRPVVLFACMRAFVWAWPHTRILHLP